MVIMQNYTLGIIHQNQRYSFTILSK